MSINKSIPGPICIYEPEVEQVFTKINTNQTLLVASLNEEGPYEAEIIPKEYTTSLGKIIEYTKPTIVVELETGDENNPSQEVTITIDGLKSFRPDDLEKRVSILQKQRALENRYQKIKAELERSKRLQEILKDSKKKAAFLEILQSIQEELEANK